MKDRFMDMTTTTTRSEFKSRRLNEIGEVAAAEVAQAFSDFLDAIEALCGADGREMAIVRTKLQEASFFAKRALVERPENQVA